MGLSGEMRKTIKAFPTKDGNVTNSSVVKIIVKGIINLY